MEQHEGSALLSSCLSSSLVYLNIVFSKGMFGNYAHRRVVHQTFSQIDQGSHFIPFMCKELGIQNY